MNPDPIQVANAPCSWGVLEFDGESATVGYEQVLSEIAETGYVGTELGDWGFLPTCPEELFDALTGYGLKLMAAFVPVRLADPAAHDEGVRTALKTARLLASVQDEPLIVLSDDNASDPTRRKNAGRILPEHGMTPEEWDHFVRGAEEIARITRDETGVRTAFHFHGAGYVETPGEIDTFLARTDPELVGLCFDTGHYAFGGGDVVEGLRRHLDRIWHVHLKDCHPEVMGRVRAEGLDYFAAVRAGVFCELGRGAVDFPGIVAELRRRAWEGWVVVEQDVLPGMGTPYQSASRNRDYLDELGLTGWVRMQ